MNSFISGIAHLFSSDPHEVTDNSVEDFNELTTYFVVEQFNKDLPAALNLNALNERDILAIGLFDGADDMASEE